MEKVKQTNNTTKQQIDDQIQDSILPMWSSFCFLFFFAEGQDPINTCLVSVILRIAQKPKYRNKKQVMEKIKL